MFKKIGAVLICAVIIALCAIDSVLAATVSFDSLRIGVFSVGQSYLAPDAIFDNLPLALQIIDSETGSRWLALDLNQQRYLSGVSACFTTDDTEPIYFESDYSYFITFAFQLRVMYNPVLCGSFNRPDVEGVFISDFSMNNYGSYESPGFSNWLNVDDYPGFRRDTTIETVYTSDSGSMRENRFDYTVSVSFSVPSDSTSITPWLSCPFYLSYEDFEHYPQVGSSEFSSQIYVYDVLVDGYYDPGQEIIETDADRIIAGQQDAIFAGQDREYDLGYDSGLDGSDVALYNAQQAFNLDTFKSTIFGVYNAFSYTGSNFHFELPAARSIPYIGTLWEEQDIPFKLWIDRVPPAVLAVLRFLAWLGICFSVVHMIRQIVDDINGGED